MLIKVNQGRLDSDSLFSLWRKREDEFATA